MAEWAERGGNVERGIRLTRAASRELFGTTGHAIDDETSEPLSQRKIFLQHGASVLGIPSTFDTTMALGQLGTASDSSVLHKRLAST